MKNSLPIRAMLLIFLLKAMMVNAQTATLVPVISDDNAIMIKVSDNGLWAAGYYEEETVYYGAKIWNLNTYEAIELIPGGGAAGAFDVTDDGSIAVGCYNNKPAYWENGVWTELPLPDNGLTGMVATVTPDGSVMGGRVFSLNQGYSYACIWENGELVQVNHSETDRMGENAILNEINGISADGNVILGCLNYNVLPNRTSFVIVDGEYRVFGDWVYDPAMGGDEYNFYDVLSLSPNGKWVTGDIYWIEDVWTNEYYCPFRYDVENDVVELFLMDNDVASFASDDYGNLYGATPLMFPMRSALVLKKDQWVSLDQELLNDYGLNVFDETGYDNLGSVFSVSTDGKTIVGCAGSGLSLIKYNWVLKLDVSTSVENKPVVNPMQAVIKGTRLVLGGVVSTVTVCDLQGKVVLNENINGKAAIFNVSHLPAGVYVVNMFDNLNQKVSNKVFIGSN
ncbi:hypothetical protein MASR1M74_02450 [Lentimicrobium sp.]